MLINNHFSRHTVSAKWYHNFIKKNSIDSSSHRYYTALTSDTSNFFTNVKLLWTNLKILLGWSGLAVKICRPQRPPESPPKNHVKIFEKIFSAGNCIIRREKQKKIFENFFFDFIWLFGGLSGGRWGRQILTSNPDRPSKIFKFVHNNLTLVNKWLVSA